MRSQNCQKKLNSYNFGNITIDGKKFTKDLIIFPEKINSNWRRKIGHLLSEDDITEILDYKLEVLIIGTGAYGLMKVDDKVRDKLKILGIEPIIKKTSEAVEAYNTARTRTIELPQRMLRYQFGPFMAYFHSLQTDELMVLTKFALLKTRTSEEAMLWRGWGLVRMGDESAALSYFNDALRIRPDYDDAITAIDYLNSN